MAELRQFISEEEFLAKNLTGKGIYFGDGNFGESHNGYHLHGEVKSWRIEQNQLILTLKWAEILYNDTHSKDDWIPCDEDRLVQQIILTPRTNFKDCGDKIYVREMKPLPKRRKNIDWTFIYFDMTTPPVKKAKKY
ncbi:MAG: hypothetical protein M3Q64_03360 [bacterium]|nr:hypothetical protein [bacterium]